MCWQKENSADSITKNSRFLLHLLPLNLNNSDNNENVFDKNKKKNLIVFLGSTTTLTSDPIFSIKTGEDLLSKDELKYGEIIRSEYTSASCHLFRELPKENCCRVVIIEQHYQNISKIEEKANNKKIFVNNNKLLLNITLKKIYS